jgi:hypothetical protein
VAKQWVPALRASVGLIAAWAAEFALSLLMGEQEEPQCFVVTDRRSPVLSFPPGREVEVIEAYLAGQEARGEVVTRRIFEQSGRFTFAQERGTVALRLPEREACERHKSVYSLDEI